MPSKRNRLLSWERYEGLAGTLTVELLMTPWESVKKVSPGASVSDAKELMARHDFDQLGVEEGGCSGLIRHNSIEKGHHGDSISSNVEWAEDQTALDTTAPLMKGLEVLCDKPSCLVRENRSTVGLVHRSDFNKQAVRSQFYLWLAALEMGLAEFILRELPDHDDWITLLRDSRQVSVAGNLYLAQRKNARMAATEYVELADLVCIVTNSDRVGKGLWKNLGYDSKNPWRDHSGSLVDLRHSIMHPVRTVISDSASAKRLIECDTLLKLLVHRVLKLLG